MLVTTGPSLPDLGRGPGPVPGQAGVDVGDLLDPPAVLGLPHRPRRHRGLEVFDGGGRLGGRFCLGRLAEFCSAGQPRRLSLRQPGVSLPGFGSLLQVHVLDIIYGVAHEHCSEAAEFFYRIGGEESVTGQGAAFFRGGGSDRLDA